MPLEHRGAGSQGTEHAVGAALSGGFQLVPPYLRLHMAAYWRAQDMGQQLRAQTNTQHGLFLTQRSLDDPQFRLQMRQAMLVLHVHRPAQYDQPVVAGEIRLGVRVTFEIVETDTVAPCTDASMERAEWLGGHVLEHH